MHQTRSETNMAKMHLHKSKIDLPADKRTKVVQLLNEQLADLIDLQLQAKQAHWNVRGPRFIALHELFDGVYAALTPLIDDTAERIGNLGGIADGTVAGVAKRTNLKSYPLDAVDGAEHVDALSTALAAAGKSTRAAIDKADDIGDADTADLFTQASRVLDQQLWFVEAHMQGGE